MEIIVIVIWSFILFVAWNKNLDFNKKIIDPLFLFIGGQLLSLIIWYIIKNTNLFVINYKFTYSSLFYLLSFSLSYSFGSLILIGNQNQYIDFDFSEKYFKIFFYINVFIGTIGTIFLLKGMGINSYINAIGFLITDFYRFDNNFFNNSMALLWQANIAALFFAPFSKFDIWKILAILVIIINIFFRAAYIYIVIGLFYFIIPVIFLKHKNFKYIFIIFIILILLVPILSLGNNLTLRNFLLKITPYTYGNFSGFNYHFNNLHFNNLSVKTYGISTFAKTFSNLGFKQIMIYIDKYFKTRLTYDLYKNPFIQQLLNTNIYGNTATFYASFTRVNYFISMLFIFILGLMNRYVYNKANKKILFLSIYSWLAVANSTSFATGGYFATTRFFPALLHIWPYLFLYFILEKIRQKIKS